MDLRGICVVAMTFAVACSTSAPPPTPSGPDAAAMPRGADAGRWSDVAWFPAAHGVVGHPAPSASRLIGALQGAVGSQPVCARALHGVSRVYEVADQPPPVAPTTVIYGELARGDVEMCARAVAERHQLRVVTEPGLTVIHHADRTVFVGWLRRYDENVMVVTERPRSLGAFFGDGSARLGAQPWAQRIALLGAETSPETEGKQRSWVVDEMDWGTLPLGVPSRGVAARLHQTDDGSTLIEGDLFFSDAARMRQALEAVPSARRKVIDATSDGSVLAEARADPTRNALRFSVRLPPGAADRAALERIVAGLQ